MIDNGQTFALTDEFADKSCDHGTYIASNKTPKTTPLKSTSSASATSTKIVDKNESSYKPPPAKQNVELSDKYFDQIDVEMVMFPI